MLSGALEGYQKTDYTNKGSTRRHTGAHIVKLNLVLLIIWVFIIN